MTWLPMIRKELDESKVKYRAETAPDPQAFLRARRLFISRYMDMWIPDVYKVIDPFDPTTGEGKVLAKDNSGAYTIMRAPYEEWQHKQGIAAEEMWGAEEDLWMLHALMKAVARVNEGASTIDNALIRRILTATLRGGSPADLNERRTKKKSQSSQQPGAPGAAGGSEGGGALGGGWGSGPRIGGMRGDTGPKALPMIDPDDVFGSGEEGSAQASAGGTKKPGGGESGTLHPYVEETPGRWRARGFVLRVLMDQQAIPKLLTALSESPFPVYIWHVEHLPYDNQKNRLQVSAMSENDVDSKRQKEIEERLALALNQSYLADVQIAGTFLMYYEPAGAAEQPAPTSKAPVPAATAGTAKGAPAAKGAAGAAAPAAASQPAGAVPTSAAPLGAPTPAKGASPKAGSGAPQPPTSAPAKAAGTPPPATTKPSPAAKS
jgi:hypothetical protein